MRIGIIANLNSSWSRQIILSLVFFGINVHPIEIISKTQLHYMSEVPEEIKGFKKEILSSRGKIHQITTPNLKLFDYFYIVKPLKKICHKEKLQSILTLYGGGFAVAVYFSWIRPYLVYLVGSDVLKTNFITNLINRITYSAAAKVFVNGRYLLDSAEKKFRLTNCQLSYIGIDIDKYRPIDKKLKNINIISTRGFLPIYNNEYIIQALPYLKKDHIFNKLIFAAGGYNLNKTKKLTDRILPNNVCKRIEFLGGINQVEMVEQLQNSSIFISVSRSDGLSISLMEAMACGVFPILSDIPANREWIKPEWKNGIIVPLGQPKKLAAAIGKAMSDKKLRQNAAKINRKIAEENFDSKKNMRLIAAEIKKIIYK